MTYIDNVRINTDKINNDKKILSISDLHLTKDLGFEHLKEIKNNVNMEEIQQIVIPGDIFNDINELRDSKFREYTLQVLDDFSYGKQVFISPGNHDLMTKKNNKWEIGNFSLFEDAIKELPNFHLLRNGEKITVNNISYSAFSLDFSYYESNTKRRKELESINEYMSSFIKQYNVNLFNNDEFNILLTHEPQSIIKLSTKKGRCIQDNTDLVVSGHMHNGMLPHFLKRFCGNMGIISPQMQIFPKYAHGTVEIGDTTFVINGAVNTRVENSLINELYGSNATVIDLVKTKRR